MGTGSWSRIASAPAADQALKLHCARPSISEADPVLKLHCRFPKGGSVLPSLIAEAAHRAGTLPFGAENRQAEAGLSVPDTRLF